MRFVWKIGLVALVIAIFISLFYGPWRQAVKQEPQSALTATSPVATPKSASDEIAKANATPDSLRELVGSLKTAASPQAARTTLATVRRDLAGMTASQASAAIRKLLDSTQDAPTQMKFGVGADGFLTEAPTLRTFLLDQLARIDPAAAAAYAEKILNAMNSPDEWAIALRNYASANTTPQGRFFLEQKMQAMLRYEPWQKDPSVGFLEAFDVAVYLGGTRLMATLTTLVRQTDNPAVSHAAFLALDRLTVANPAAALEKLQTEPDLMKGREVTRANYFARAEAGDPSQRAILEKYLLDPQLSATELKTFAGLYPNANYMVSYNLLTRTQTPDHETLTRRDRDALGMIESWLADPRFEKVQPQLQTIRSRLQTFVTQAVK